MVTIAIMGIAFVAILTGVAIAISASDSHRQEATGEGIVRSFAERVIDPKDTPYVPCASAGDYQNPSGFELPAPAGARASRRSRTSSRESRRRRTAAVVPPPISARNRSRSRCAPRRAATPRPRRSSR